MEERSTVNISFQQNNSDDDDDDNEVGGQIQGYTSSSSLSVQGPSSSSRLQRKDGDGQLDDEDFERILSRTTARKLLSLFEGIAFEPMLNTETISGQVPPEVIWRRPHRITSLM